MKILFYAPHSGIWLHAFPEALVAESLAKSGHEVVYVTCGRLLESYCVTMSASGVAVLDSPDAKRAVCDQCTAKRDLIRSQFGFQGYDLADRVTTEERAAARRLLDGGNRDRILALELDGLPVGRYALYEFLLDRKKAALTFNDEEWRDYLLRLESAVLSLYAARRILREEQPDRVVVYNALYSVNRVACELAERLGVPTYFLHNGLNSSRRLQTLLLGARNPFRYYEDMIAAWPRFREQLCEPRMMATIADHFLVLIRGVSPFGYSSAVRTEGLPVRKRFGIAAEQKVLVASMSSNDERFAAESGGALAKDDSLLFATQVEWIAALVNHVRERPELFLIVRVHPRDFPNRREGVKSEHASHLEATLRDLPPNVAVNWPSDGFSLFEIASEAAVFLNAWSAVGKEVAILGIPVVLYAPSLVAYPPELNYFATTLDGYFAAIDKALAEGWSVERARLAFRWLAVEYSHGLIDIGDAFRRSDLPNHNLSRRIARRLARAVYPRYAERLDCALRPARLAASGEIAEILEKALPTPCALPTRRASNRVVALEQETASLRSQLRRIGEEIFSTGGDGMLERNLLQYNGEWMRRVSRIKRLLRATFRAHSVRRTITALRARVNDAFALTAGLVAHAATGRTPDYASQAMIRFFCRTRGRSNDLMTRAIRFTDRRASLPPPQGELGLSGARDVERAVDLIRRDGYFVFEQTLPPDMCDRLLHFALRTPTRIRPMTGQNSAGQPDRHAVYERAHPLAVRYDFDPADVLSQPDVQTLLTNPAILNIAQSYLGSTPIADVINMWWHTAYSDQPDEEAAQFFHFDMDRIKWLKFFIYLTDVGPDSGPHSFLRGSHRTGGIPKALLSKGYARLSDAEVAQHYAAEDAIQFLGPRGTLLAEDTRGLHKGLAVHRGDRLMLQLQFSNSLFGATYPKCRFGEVLTPNLARMINQHRAIYSNYLS